MDPLQGVRAWEFEAPGSTIMKDPIFENYSYAQQANSLKMRVNWIVPAVIADMTKGRRRNKTGVSQYPAKVIRQLETTIRRLQRIR